MRKRMTRIAIVLMVAILGYSWYAGNLLSAIGEALGDHPNSAPAAKDTGDAAGRATGGVGGFGGRGQSRNAFSTT